MSECRKAAVQHNVLLLSVPTIPMFRRGIDRLAFENNWNLRVEPLASPPTDWDGDGVLFMLTDDKNKRVVEQFKRRKIPIVAISSELPEIRMARATGDDEAIGRLAAEHFNVRDFKNAVFFSAAEESVCHRDRLRGFKKAWRGGSLKTWLWINEADVSLQANPVAMQAWLVEKLKDAPKPLAVFAWND